MKFNLKETYRRITKFLTEDLWQFDIENLTNARARLIKYLKVIVITFKTFSKERIGYQAIALSFLGTLAIVPFVAVMFAVSDGFGLSDKLATLLYTYFDNSQETVEMVIGAANNIVETTQSGVVGLFSGILFTFTIFWLMLMVEKVFNNVWRVRKSRNFFKRIGFYILILVLSPFVIMLFFSSAIVYTNALQSIGLGVAYFDTISSVLAWVIFYVIATLVLSVMYKFIPNYKVRYVNAIKASVLSGLVFTILQYLYLETQVFITRLNVVYGALAIVPLFMIWMNIGWWVILYGAELSYAFQNVNNYNLDD